MASKASLRNTFPSMTSKVLLHKVPPVSKQRSHLPLNALQAIFLSWDTAQPSRTLLPAQGASFTTGQRGHPPRNCLGQYNRGRTPSLLAMPSGTLTPYSSDHMNLRRTEITRLYARLYAAGPMLQSLLSLGYGHGGRRLAAAAAAAAAVPPAVRPWMQGRGRGLGCGRLGGRLWLQLPISYLFPILKLSCQLSKAQA